MTSLQPSLAERDLGHAAGKRKDSLQEQTLIVLLSSSPTGKS